MVEALAENPKQVEAYRKGKTKIIGFFVQRVMEKTKSGANPEIALRLFEKHLTDFSITPPG